MTLLDRLNPWPLYALIASLAMLAAAHAFETFGQMAPCALCLKQREAYWIVAGVSVVALAVQRWRSDAAALRALNALIFVGFAAGAVVAGFHAGVEQKWWPGLASCAGTALSADVDLLAALEAPSKAAGCDTIPWSMLGLSMAAWNMLISLGLAAISLRKVLAAGDFGTGLDDRNSRLAEIER
jgi:disulfide bond formation protein DsbB